MDMRSKLKTGIFVGLVICPVHAWATVFGFTFASYTLEHWSTYWGTVNSLSQISNTVGAGLVMVCGVIWFLNRRQPKPMPDKDRAAAILALSFGIFLNVLAFAVTVPFAFVPAGAVVSSKPASVVYAALGSLGLFVGPPMAIISFITERCRKLGIVAVLVLIAPSPLGAALFWTVWKLRGFALAP